MKDSQYNIIPHDYTIWLLYEINVRLPQVTGLLYQRELVPVPAFHDVRSAFLVFLGKKLLAGMASELGSKKGKSDLRNALYQAAVIASLKNKDFIAYFANKIADHNRIFINEISSSR